MTHLSSPLLMSLCFCLTVANVVLAASSTTTTTTKTTTKPATSFPTKTTEDDESEHEVKHDKQSRLDLDLPLKASSLRVPPAPRHHRKAIDIGWTGLKKKGGKIGRREEISLPLSPLFSSLMYDFWKPTDTVSVPLNHAEEHTSLEERFDQLFPSWPTHKIGGVSTTRSHGQLELKGKFRGGLDESDDESDNSDGGDAKMIDFEVRFPPLRSSTSHKTDGVDPRDAGRPFKSKLLMHLVNSVLYPDSGSRRFQQHRPLDRRHGIGRLLTGVKHLYDDYDEDDDIDGSIDWNREWKKPYHRRRQPHLHRSYQSHHQLNHHHEHRHKQQLTPTKQHHKQHLTPAKPHHKQQKVGNEHLADKNEWVQQRKHHRQPKDEERNRQRVLQRHFGKKEQEKQQTQLPQPRRKLQQMQQEQQQQQQKQKQLQQQYKKPRRAQQSDGLTTLKTLLDKTEYTKHGEIEVPLSVTRNPVKAGHDFTSIEGNKKQMDGEPQSQHTGASINVFPYYGTKTNRKLTINTDTRDSVTNSLYGSHILETGQAESSKTDTAREMKGVDKTGAATEMGSDKQEVIDVEKGNHKAKKHPSNSATERTLSFSSSHDKAGEESGDVLGMIFSPRVDGSTSDKKTDEEHSKYNDHGDNRDDNRQTSPLGYNLVDEKVKNGHHKETKVNFQGGHDVKESVGKAHLAFVDGELSGRAGRNRRGAAATTKHDTVRNKMSSEGLNYNHDSPKHNNKGLHHARNILSETGELGSTGHGHETKAGDNRIQSNNDNNNKNNNNSNNNKNHKDLVKHIEGETKSHDRRRTEKLSETGTIQHSGVSSTINKEVSEGVKNTKDGKDKKHDNKWFGRFSFDHSPASPTGSPLLSSPSNKTNTAEISKTDERRIHMHQGALGMAILGLMVFVVVAISCTISCASASNQGMRRADSRTAIYSPNNYYDDHNDRRQNFAFQDT